MAKRLSIRPVLIVLFVIQICAVGSLIGWLSLRNGRQSVQDLANDLLDRTASLIDEQVFAYLKEPMTINRANYNVIRVGKVNMDDFSTLGTNGGLDLGRHLWSQMKMYDNPFDIYVANERGDFVGVARRVNELYLQLSSKKTKQVYSKFALDAEGKPGKLMDTEHFDPRVRPWYISAKQAGKPGWTDLYPFVRKAKLGITAIHPYYNQAGAFRGVLATDIEVTYFSRYMHGLTIGKTGRAFILNREGVLVSASSLEPLFTMKKDNKVELIQAVNSTDPLISQAAVQLKTDFGDYGRIDKPHQFSYNDQGRLIQGDVTPLTGDIGLNWLIVVVVPQEDFMEHINANTRTTILLCLVALALATLVGSWLTGRITSPLNRLTGYTKGLAAQDFKADEVVRTGLGEISQSRWEEVSHLATSFVEMEGELQSYIVKVQDATAARERVESELRVGRKIQMSVLPKKFPPFPNRQEFELHAQIEPAKEMSGDFFDFYMIDDDHLYFTIGDVSGKGVPASLLMVTCRALLEATANELSEPDPLLTKVNRELSRKNDALQFVTVFYAILDLRTGEVRYATPATTRPTCCAGAAAWRRSPG